MAFEDMWIDLSDFETEWTSGWLNTADSALAELDIDLSDFEPEVTEGGEDGWDSIQQDDSESEEPKDGEEPKEDKDKEEDKEGGDAGNTSDLEKEIDELLGSLDEDNESAEESVDELDELIKSLESAEDTAKGATLVKQLRADLKASKTSAESLEKLVSRLNSEKWDLTAKNAELELYGGSDDVQLVYLNNNMQKALAGDDKEKSKVLNVIDELRVKIAGKTKEDEDNDSFDDKLSKMETLNSKTNPNKEAEDQIENFELNF